MQEGELRCIIGPIGAGKTTMMDSHHREDLEPDIKGEELNINLMQMNEAEIANAGVGRKFQKPTVIEMFNRVAEPELATAGDRSVWAIIKGYVWRAERQTDFGNLSLFTSKTKR